MKRAILMVVALGALTVAAVALAAPDKYRTHGNITHPTGAGFVSKMNINAELKDDHGTLVPKGKVKTKVVDPATDELVREWEGEVDCYLPNAVGGDPTTSRIGGFVTKSKHIKPGQGGEDVTGQYFRITVDDNGKKKDDPPDEIVAERFPVKPPQACNVGGVPMFPETKGNITVEVPTP